MQAAANEPPPVGGKVDVTHSPRVTKVRALDLAGFARDVPNLHLRVHRACSSGRCEVQSTNEYMYVDQIQRWAGYAHAHARTRQQEVPRAGKELDALHALVVACKEG